MFARRDVAGHAKRAHDLAVLVIERKFRRRSPSHPAIGPSFFFFQVHDRTFCPDDLLFRVEGWLRVFGREKIKIRFADQRLWFGRAKFGAHRVAHAHEPAL